MFNLESEKSMKRVKPQYRNDIISRCNEINRLSTNLTGSLDSDQNVLSKIRNAASSLKMHCNNLPLDNSNHHRHENCSSTFNVEIKEYSSSLYMVTFDCHLPCINDKSVQEYFDTFFNASIMYEFDHGFLMMKRAVVLFINYYSKDEFWIDCDNINYKPFIDGCVKNFILPDDNGKYLQLMSIAKEGNPHTEAYIGSLSEILDIVISLES